MALSGSVATSSSSGRSVTLKWTAIQSVSNNTSKISWELVGSGSSSEWVVVSELKVTINGLQAYYRNSSNHTNCYNGTKLANGSTTISHNSDGTKSFSIKVEAGIYNWAINCSGSSTFTLNTIARASGISSASNVTLGNKCSVKWTPTSSSFKYKLKFSLGKWNYTTGYINPGTTSAYTYTGYTIPLTVASQLPKTTSGTMTAYLYTYSGSTQIGSTASKTFTVVIPSSIIPTIESVTATIDNSNNSIVNSWGIAVAGYTKVKIAASAKGSYGSTIRSFTISGGYSTTQSGTSLSYTSSAITSSGNKTFSIVAKDSRGRNSTSKSSSVITFYAYFKPTISSFTVARSPTDSKKVVVNANWSYASVNGKNSATCTLYYKRSKSSTWTNYGTISRNISTTLTATFEEQYSYNFRIIVKDSLNSSAQEEGFISTIDVLMDFRAGGKGLGIGKIAESDNLEIALNAIFMGNVYIKVDSTNVPLKTYIKNVINGTYD